MFKGNEQRKMTSAQCVQYVFSMLAKLWSHSDIRSCYHQSLYAFTFRYDSTSLGHNFFTPKVFLHDILYEYFIVHYYYSLLIAVSSLLLVLREEKSNWSPPLWMEQGKIVDIVSGFKWFFLGS